MTKLLPELGDSEERKGTECKRDRKGRKDCEIVEKISWEIVN